MKAKYFSKLRKELKLFYVLKTDGLFGDFKDYRGDSKELQSFTLILALSPKNAVERYCKKRNIYKRREWDEDRECWAHFKVFPHNKPYHKHATYWR